MRKVLSKRGVVRKTKEIFSAVQTSHPAVYENRQGQKLFVLLSLFFSDSIDYIIKRVIL